LNSESFIGTGKAKAIAGEAKENLSGRKYATSLDLSLLFAQKGEIVRWCNGTLEV